MKPMIKRVARRLGVGVAAYHAARLLHATRGWVSAAGCALSNPQLFANLPFGQRGVQFAQTAISPPPVGESGRAAPPSGALFSYFNAHRKGPGIWKWLHYFEIYERHFSKFIGREVHILEVGIYSGGSLGMWREYFGKDCRVYGVDIEDACKVYKNETTEIFIGDQADRSFWAKVRAAAPRIDILIDDGGHTPEQQRITLEEMLPHLRPGGVYLCEDVLGISNPFAAFTHGLAQGLNSATTPSPLPPGTTGASFSTTKFQASIHSVHLYPWVAVVEKREQPLDNFISPKHGTQWQPFL